MPRNGEQDKARLRKEEPRENSRNLRREGAIESEIGRRKRGVREKLKEEIENGNQTETKMGIEGEKMKERERWIKRGSETNLKMD